MKTHQDIAPVQDRTQLTETPEPEIRSRRSILGKLIRFVVCVVIIGAGVLIAIYLMQSSPRARKRPPEKMSSLVQAEPVYPATRHVWISAMGTVVPAKTVSLKPRVSGQVTEVHPDFIEGGFLKKGDKVIQIDDADYRLILAQKRSALVNAQYALKLEQGRQAVAKREWQLLKKGKKAVTEDADLALRKPHLDKVKADLKAAQADLEQAKLQLKRTTVYAPFNAVIRATHVEFGSLVTSQTALADLVGVDEYFIRTSVPVSHLKWISPSGNMDQTAVRAKILYRNGLERTGTVVKLLSDLETEGRMARLLISVKDPLNLNHRENSNPPLLLGEYVRIEIEGQTIDNAYQIPRTALRDNTHIWIVRDDMTLEIREVETVWRDKNSVLIKKGLTPGERIILSSLSTPVEGMPVSIENQDRQTEKKHQTPAPEKLTEG